MASLATPPFSATSPWNTEVPSGSSYTALNWPTSTGYNYTVSWSTYSPSVYVASATDPLVTVTYPPGWGYPGGTVSLHMPTAANGAAGTDGEVVVIDGDIAYNFWQFDRTSATTATASAMGDANVVSGTGFGTKTPFLGAGTTAIGASELGGLITQADQTAGAINHALQLAVDVPLAKAGFVGEAIAGDGSSATGIVQEGELLAIPADTPMPAGLSALGQEVFTAMQKYGAYVVDRAGGDTAVRAQANAFDATTMTALWHDMGSIAPLLEAVTPASASSGATATPQPTTPATAPVTPPATDPVTPPVTAPVTPQAAAPVAPTINWVAANGPGVTNGAGTVGVGATIRLAVNFSETVDVAGTPTISLNTGGVARYVSGSGSSTLQFDYTVAAGQNATDLAITSYNLGGVTDATGDSVNLSGAPTQPAGTLTVNTKSSFFGNSWRHQTHTSATTLAASTSVAQAPLAASVAQAPLVATAPLSSSTTTTSAKAGIEFTTSGDGVHDRRLVLLGQYAASNFQSSSLMFSGSSQLTDSGQMHFLATPRSHA